MHHPLVAPGLQHQGPCLEPTAGPGAPRSTPLARRRHPGAMGSDICHPYRTLRFSAEVLPRLVMSSYSTCCPSLSVLKPARSTAEIWTKMSLPPPWSWMKPVALGRVEPLNGACCHHGA